MLQRFIPSLGIVLVCGVVSQAAIIPIVQKQVNPGPGGGAYDGFALSAFTTDTQLNAGVLANTWVSYSIGVQATAGEKISALAPNITAVVGPNAGYHQRWNISEETGTSPTPESGLVTNGDSHLIRLGSAVGAASTENNNQPGGPPSASDTSSQDYGVGSFLMGQWGFNQAEQDAQMGNVVRFAYLVVPRGFEPMIELSVGVGFNDEAGTPNPNGVIFTGRDFFPIPEPATVTLFGLALIGALGFGRRRS